MPETVTTTTRRRSRSFQRRAVPRPWFPAALWPLLLLIGAVLAALVWFPMGTVEPAVERSVRYALQQANHPWALVSVDGQEVTLRGTPPTPTAADDARTVAEQAQAATWAGPLVARSRVFTDFDEVRVGPPAAWQFQRGDQGIVLTGQVADEAARRDAVEVATALGDGVDGWTVDDQLVVADTDASGLGAVVRAGLAPLQHCLVGRSTLAEGVLSFACEVADEATEAAVRTDVAARLDADAMAGSDVTLGSVQLLVRSVADDCDAQFAGLLEEPIRFATGNAEVQAASFPLLDRIAQTAQSCPGDLRIEGHTDATGDPDANVVLSQARADAVRTLLVERGVTPARLRTSGLGADEPVADNATPAGRAANRRIEVEIVRPLDR